MHFIGDFICQTDEMVKGKSTNLNHLTNHIFVYGEVLTVMITLLLVVVSLMGYWVPWYKVIGYILINMFLHWVTDYFTSKMTAKLWTEKRVRDFFIIIGVEQLIHSFCLIISFYMVFFM